MNELTQTQIAAIARFERLKVGALFMEMGTGKTRVALDLMAARTNKCDLFIWICPCALKDEIERERMKWHPELPLTVIGCESIGSSERIYNELKTNVLAHKCVFAVVDESLKIKNRTAKRTQRICDLSKHTEYRLILNGTPISKNILDLWTQMFFLCPRILNCSYYAFMMKYCDIEYEAGRAPKILRMRNIDHLMASISPYVFDAKLFIDVPRRHAQTFYEVCEAEYEQLKLDILSEFDDQDHLQDVDFYTLITRLQKYYTSQPAHAAAVQKAIKSFPDNEQIIVFCKYLESIPKDAASITGATPQKDRNSIIDAFRNGATRILWITYGIGAYGLNLQFSHNIIFADHVWDYAQRVQAEARVYRTGQTHDVVIHDVICSNAGLEKLIMQNIERKAGASAIIKHSLDTLKKEL